LIIALGISLLIPLGVAADLVLRAAHQGNGAGPWMQTFSLFNPALQSAGTPGRHPEMVHPAVHPHFAAGLEHMP
jgi:hypothetical protein